MIHRFLGLLCLAAVIAAAPVTVTGTIRRPDGALATGLATIELNNPCVNGSGNLILDRALNVRFDAGVFSVQLEPTTVCPVTTYYRVRYRVDRVWISAYEYWSIPPSPTTTTIQTVRLQDAAPPVFARATAKGDISVFDGVQWQKLPKGVDGQVLKADSAATLGVNWGTGGGAGAQSWTSPSLNFGTLVDYSCADQTFTATGLTLGTPLVVAPPAGAPLVDIDAWPSATGTAKVRACNSGGADAAVSGVFIVQVANSYLSASATLDFPIIIAGGHQSLTITVTGATTSMGARATPPAAFEAGLRVSARVTAPNVVTITAGNFTDADINPAPGSFIATVTQ